MMTVKEITAWKKKKKKNKEVGDDVDLEQLTSSRLEKATNQPFGKSPNNKFSDAFPLLNYRSIN